MRRKGQSLTRQIKRGNVKYRVNPDTGYLEFYRRTRNSRDFTVYIGGHKIGG